MLLNTLFPNAKGTKTEAGAYKRIEKVRENIHEDDARFIRYAVVRRPDDTFVAIAIFTNERATWLMHYLMSNHICVTN